MQLALGLIETKGLVGAIEAADAMAKAADVKIISKEKITAALVTIKITGEVAAVRSALDAGAAAAQKVGQLVSVHIIPRPDDQLDAIILGEPDKSGTEPSGRNSDPSEGGNAAESMDASSDASSGSALSDDPDESDDDPEDNEVIEIVDLKNIDFDELETMSVHKLRRMARGLGQFPIRGREISKANKQILLDYFRKLK